MSEEAWFGFWTDEQKEAVGKSKILNGAFGWGVKDE
jgi:hypothetical protein